MSLELNLLPDIKKEYLKSKQQRNLVVSVSILASIISGGIIVALLLAIGGLEVQKNVLMGQIGDADNPDSNSYIGKIKAAQEDEEQDLNGVLTVQNNLAQISSLKQQQSIFSRMFYGSEEEPGFLAQMNPAEPVVISLQQMKIGQTGGNVGAIGTEEENVIELQGVAWNRGNSNGSFDALNTYVATLRNTKISYSNGKDGEVVTEDLFSKVTVTQQQLAQDASQTDNKTLPVSFTITLIYNKAAFNVNSMNISIKVLQKSSSDAILNAPSSVFSTTPLTVDNEEKEGDQ